MPSKRRSPHPGVKVLELATGAMVARWVDPVSKRQEQVNLRKLGKTSAEARRRWCMDKAAKLAELRAAVAGGRALPTRLGMAETLANYLERFDNIGTRRDKNGSLRPFVAWCVTHGAADTADLTPSHLALFADYWFRPKTSKLSLSTRNKNIVAVAVFTNWLRDIGAAPLLTAEDVRRKLRRRPGPVSEIKFLRQPELRGLFEACLRHDRDSQAESAAGPYMLLAFLTGCRREELRRLEWNEIDLHAQEIRLPAHKVKTKRSRCIDLSVCPVAVRLLERLRLTTPGDRVFPTLGVGSVWWLTHRLRKKYGAPAFTMHSLRRSCGTYLTCAPNLYGAASAFMSAKRLGHGVEVAEAHYAGVLRDLPAHKTLEEVAGIADLADAVVESVGTAPAADASAAS